jgi:DNA-binding CsgD family transcriptional regulator
MENELLENINRNLEVIIGLLLRSIPDSEAASLRDRILMLTAMGMRPNEIARALGKSANHVNKELSIGRSTEQKRGKTKK